MSAEPIALLDALPSWTPDEIADVDRRATDRLGARTLSAIERTPPLPLLLGKYDAEDHTIKYGSGGVGKGVHTTWDVVQLAAAGHRVLILDYEAHPGEWARRFYGLAGVTGMDDVWHVSPLAIAFDNRHGPIWETQTALRELADEVQATYLVIDSIVTACFGADPMDPGTPALYASALQFIGRPAMSLAHVTKDGDLRYPFGSVFWHNLARVTWSMAKDGDRVVMTQRKANNHASRGRIMVTTTWHDDLPREVLEQSYTVVLADRIDDVLDAPMTVSRIVARLNEDAGEDLAVVKSDSVRHTLRRGLTSDPKRYTVEGTGEAQLWGRA